MRLGLAAGSRATSGAGDGYTTRGDNAHRTEQREVLYPWHPWFGRVVDVHEVIEKGSSCVFRCSLEGGPSGRWIELPVWMFDRGICLSLRVVASPQVDRAALLVLKECLAHASGAAPREARPSNVPVSGAEKNSCNRNRGPAHATPSPSTQPSSRRRAVRSLRSAGGDALTSGAEVARAAGGDPRDSNPADGAPARRPRMRRSPAPQGGRAP